MLILSVKVLPALAGHDGDVSTGVGGAVPWAYTVPPSAPGAYEYPVTELNKVQLVPTKLKALQPIVLSHKARHEATLGRVALLDIFVIIADVAFAADVSSEPDMAGVPESSSACDASSVGGTSLMSEVSISVPWYKMPHWMA
jgi:hypothetical protein